MCVFGVLGILCSRNIFEVFSFSIYLNIYIHCGDHVKHGALTLVGEMEPYTNDDSYYYVTTKLGRALPGVTLWAKQHRRLALLAPFCPWHCSVAVKTASK